MNKDFSPVIVRFGIGAVFLWFGINQLLFPSDFLAYLPAWAIENADLLVRLNGVTELVLATVLLSGFLTRIAAGILALKLLGIITMLGYSDIAVRDFGLLVATISIVVHGKDRWSR